MLLKKPKRQGRAIENQGCGRSFKFSGQGVSIKRWGGFHEADTISIDAESERPVLHTGKDSFAVKQAEP